MRDVVSRGCGVVSKYVPANDHRKSPAFDFFTFIQVEPQCGKRIPVIDAIYSVQAVCLSVEQFMHVKLKYRFQLPQKKPFKRRSTYKSVSRAEVSTLLVSNMSNIYDTGPKSSLRR